MYPPKDNLDRVKRKNAFEYTQSVLIHIGLSCAYAKTHPGLCSPLIHSIVFNHFVSGQRMPWSDCASVQSDLSLPGGGGGGNLGVIMVRLCDPVFQNLPHSYTWPLKKQTNSYTWSSKLLTSVFIYCPLIFCNHLFLVVRQISKSIHSIPREQAASKNLWAKNMCIYQDVRKMGPFT